MLFCGACCWLGGVGAALACAALACAALACAARASALAWGAPSWRAIDNGSRHPCAGCVSLLPTLVSENSGIVLPIISCNTICILWITWKGGVLRHSGGSLLPLALPLAAGAAASQQCTPSAAQLRVVSPPNELCMNCARVCNLRPKLIQSAWVNQSQLPTSVQYHQQRAGTTADSAGKWAET